VTVLLRTHRLCAFYGDFQALFDVDLEVCAGETVAFIGANGAGKSTLLRALVGLAHVPPEAIWLDDRPVGGLSPMALARLGIALVPEGRRLFPSLTVEENLLMGSASRRGGSWDLARVYELFPGLRDRRRSPGTALSGGQQQMVAVGRALMANPRLLLCDELSLGLAPIVTREIYARLAEVRASGTALVIVEQDIGQALRFADRVACLQEGRVTLSGRPDALRREQISAAYFGVRR
jgi:branched-chain amino acid transport system ATP-binding protein